MAVISPLVARWSPLPNRMSRKKKDLTQQELADLSHVSVKQIASIEKGQINPSYLILKALAKVLPLSLDTLINPDVSSEDEGANQMKMLYCSCPSEMRDTLLPVSYTHLDRTTSARKSSCHINAVKCGNFFYPIYLF